jgi:outer membrane protein
MTRMLTKAGGTLFAAILLLLPETSFPAGTDLSDSIRGDLGGALYADHSPIRSVGTQELLLPYGFFDYGRFFARLDTLGIKTLPLAYGYLELAGRVKFDGYTTGNASLHGISERQNSLPLGIGTFQVTPVGAFFVNAFHDFNQSHGNLYEFVYAAEADLGWFVLYPQAGVEYYSDGYTRYYYGVSSAEAAASGYAAYAPGPATIPSLGLVLEISIRGNWYSNLYLRRRWLDSTLTRSPLVDTRFEDTGFVSINYRYK